MFVQPCIIKKNNKKLRATLEKIGYNRVALKSDDPNYNNDKEPWIVCAYNIYVCLDKVFLNEFSEMIKSFLNDDECKYLSHDIIDCGKDDNLFLETAKKQ